MQSTLISLPKGPETDCPCARLRKPAGERSVRGLRSAGRLLKTNQAASGAKKAGNSGWRRGQVVK